MGQTTVQRFAPSSTEAGTQSAAAPAFLRQQENEDHQKSRRGAAGGRPAAKPVIGNRRRNLLPAKGAGGLKENRLPNHLFVVLAT